MLSAVIFDFDGVIVDTEMMHFDAFNEVLAPYGVNISKQSYYQDYVTYNDIECFQKLSADFSLKLNDVDIAKLIEDKFIVFTRLAKEKDVFLKGARDLILSLKKNNITLAICSGSFRSEIDLFLGNTELIDAFDVIVTSDTPGLSNGKPHPDPYIVTLKKLQDKTNENILPEQCVVIEDSLGGLKSAADAGMHTIAVPNTFSIQQLTPHAQKVVQSLMDVDIEDIKALCS